MITVGPLDADGAVLLPLEVEERLLGAHLVRGLDPAPGLQGEVSVLHGADVPPPAPSLRLQLERLRVLDLLLVGRHVNTWGYIYLFIK